MNTLHPETLKISNLALKRIEFLCDAQDMHYRLYWEISQEGTDSQYTLCS